ncbi:SEC-C metal-binding domain-containing protein [Bradyrhizobium acaciae]|uniref:SEC-C metal-binding domain-containing protein n=1 Tax=Bradyrhizobium acaciae TaxID=2683706 RepID=UPI001E57C2C2|nr:SEC-C metal-binding domain-containing protein [Bradyrhizobium acaciae]MCC8982642.1 SEC-C domain-containing protein [Bradyrhizobium acaciae]
MMVKISHNQPCPCGSGLRHKHCHGSFAPDPYPQDLFPSDVDTFSERYNGRANAMIMECGLQTKHSVVAELWPEAYLGASAEMQDDGTNVIKINRGTVFLLRDLFDQMLSHPSNFPHIGWPSREIVHRDYQPKRKLYDLTTTAQRNWQPKDPARAKYASDLALAAIDHLFDHELGHIFNGHTALLKQVTGSSLISEAGSTSPLSALDYQAFEYQADCFAIGQGLHRLRTGPGVTAKRVYDLLCAIYLQYRIWTENLRAISVERVLTQKKHPPANIRLRLILGSSVEVMFRRKLMPMPNFGELMVNAMLECEEGLARLTRTFIDPDKLMDDGGLTEQVTPALHDTFKKLRPRLLPYSFGGRLSPDLP